MENRLDSILSELPLKDFAIGNDVVFLPEFKASWNTLFQQKVYTENEIRYCELFDDAVLRYASTWAAKEAVYKAIKQLNSNSVSFKSIEIIREKPAGKPEVRIQKHLGKFSISLSITHDGEYVWAAALAKVSES